MPPAKVRAIIFDIGGVLVRMNISNAITGLAGDISLSPEEIWSTLQKDPRWPDWQQGRISPRNWHQHVSKRLGSKLNFDQFVVAWNSALDPSPMQKDEFLEKLGKDYRLAVLSNTDPLHVAHLEHSYGFLSYFPVRIYSCRVGATKPNPLIYKEALSAAKVSAQETAYIDDIPTYAEAAERLGIRALRYQSPEQLRDDLTRLGAKL